VRRKEGEESGRTVLERVERERSSVLGSSLGRAVRHFAAADADPADRVELWGRRVGRGLSLLGVVALALLLLWQLSGR
jgi:hypothetical protein